MAAIFSSVRSSQSMLAAGRGPSRRQSITRSGVTMKSSGTSWLDSGIVPAAQTWSSCTVVTQIVSGPIRPAAVASANSRSANPPPLPSRAPSSPAATQPITTRSTGASSASVTRRAERVAPLIEAALRGGSLRCAGSRAKNGSGSASRGTAMYTVLPSSSARWRTGHWAESGLDFTVRAACQAGSPRSRSAAASAPVKFGMRPAAPGNRATLAARIAVHTSWRRAALLASSPAGPPASRSCLGAERGMPLSCQALSFSGGSSGGVLVEPEADLQRDLEAAAAVLDPAADVGDLEPVQVVQGPRGAGHGPPDRVVDAVGGRADDLADGVDVVCHE